MGNRIPTPSSSLSLNFALIISFSLASSYTTATTTVFPSSLSFLIKPPPTTKTATSAKTSASDLLSLLGTPQQASSINAQLAQQLRSCLRFLVPFIPTAVPNKTPHFPSRKILTSNGGECRGVVDQLVWWPPEPVMELARLAVDSGGDPASIQRALDPTIIPVPDVEGSTIDRCELTRTPYGRRFINEELNSYMEFLFEAIVAQGPTVGLHVSLNRYDLFHGHVFLAKESGRLGILFHAKEYPAFDKDVFPCNMGYCQVGSNVTYDDSLNLRNILWLAPLASNSTRAWLAPGVLVVLDAHPGGIIYQDLIPEYVQFVRTIYEDDFGDVVVDVNYLNVGEAGIEYQIFLC